MALLLEIQKNWFGEDGTIMSDPKLESFKGILDKQIAKEPQRKIIVFTEFADTADYLGKALQAYGLPVFKYTSADTSQTNKNTINANFNAERKRSISGMTIKYSLLPMQSLKATTCIVQERLSIMTFHTTPLVSSSE